MTISRGVLRVLLATVAVGGVVVTYGATRNAIHGAFLMVPDCNCNTYMDCDPGGKGWKCTSEANLCNTVPGCGTQSQCAGYCERTIPE